MHIFGSIPTTQYAWECSFVTKIRDFIDGMIFLDFAIDFNKLHERRDFYPQFRINLVVMNINIVDFALYNINHVDE
jgi:hypothetical protein